MQVFGHCVEDRRQKVRRGNETDHVRVAKVYRGTEQKNETSPDWPCMLDISKYLMIHELRWCSSLKMTGRCMMEIRIPNPQEHPLPRRISCVM